MRAEYWRQTLDISANVQEVIDVQLLIDVITCHIVSELTVALCPICRQVCVLVALEALVVIREIVALTTRYQWDLDSGRYESSSVCEYNGAISDCVVEVLFPVTIKGADLVRSHIEVEDSIQEGSVHIFRDVNDYDLVKRIVGVIVDIEVGGDQALDPNKLVFKVLLHQCIVAV